MVYRTGPEPEFSDSAVRLGGARIREMPARAVWCEGQSVFEHLHRAPSNIAMPLGRKSHDSRDSRSFAEGSDGISPPHACPRG
jgi:hypothetical protein